MNKLLLAALATAAVLSFSMMMTDSDSHSELDAKMSKWADFKKTYSRSYSSSTEEAYRMSIFFQNLYEIESHNAQNLSWTKAVNNFADLSNDEFKATYLGYKPHQKRMKKLNLKETPIVSDPSSIDWVSKGDVQPVKDQGACGSCWAFSAVGSIEGSYAIFQNLHVNLSEQQLVSCSGDWGNYGCDGGLMDSAFQYIIAGHPLALQDEYPYTDGRTSRTSSCKSKEEKLGKYAIASYIDVEPNNSADLYSKLTIQPISVAVDASTWSFYSGGVVQEKNCNDELNHGVTLVGYTDVDGKGNDYWVIKNSWGTSWGTSYGSTKGFIYLQADMDKQTSGTCGVAAAASYTEL